MKPLDRGGPELIERRFRLLKTSASREIAQPPDVVWKVISDHTTWTSWHEDYDEHEAITERTSGVGAQFRTKEWVLRSESEIVRWEPGEVVGLTVLRIGSLRWLISSYYSEIAIEPLDGRPDSCLVNYRAGLTGTWAFWLLSAYTIGQSLGGIYLDARASLKKLERYASECTGEASGG